MTEWGVYLVVASLLTAAITIAKPIAALTRTNTKLECAAEKLSEAIEKLDGRITEAEAELRRHSSIINKHETEINTATKRGRKVTI